MQASSGYGWYTGGILAVLSIEEGNVRYGVTYPFSDKASDYVRNILGDINGIVIRD
ncbi:MAG: hypothetical protein LBM69_00985 [Lachnospiraceae bacterium]|jgi:hypothetical protein|nr:hypothetical protein [Lachnospiraceae bacterium]